MCYKIVDLTNSFFVCLGFFLHLQLHCVKELNSDSLHIWIFYSLILINSLIKFIIYYLIYFIFQLLKITTAVWLYGYSIWLEVENLFKHALSAALCSYQGVISTTVSLGLVSILWWDKFWMKIQRIEQLSCIYRDRKTGNNTAFLYWSYENVPYIQCIQSDLSPQSFWGCAGFVEGYIQQANFKSHQQWNQPDQRASADLRNHAL